jgi:hypothetical protein
MECGGCRQLGAPGLLLNFDAQGNAAQGIQIKFDNPTGGDVNHFIAAARCVHENFYRRRVTVTHDAKRVITPQEIGLQPGDSFFLSVASLDKVGHESLFAYSAAIPPPVRFPHTPITSKSRRHRHLRPRIPPKRSSTTEWKKLLLLGRKREKVGTPALIRNRSLFTPIGVDV